MLRKKIKNIISNIIDPLISKIIETSESQKLLQGKLLAELNKTKGIVENLEEIEFKVFSQWGDDGIIQYLIQNIEIPNKTFVEFGVDTYEEANTRFLLMNNNWSGLIMDGSTSNMNKVSKSDMYWQFDLQAKGVFVTKENVNKLILSAGFEKEVGILHIDIDGNDYWIWKEIDCIDPIIVIMEYNSLFGKDHAWTTIYSHDMVRSNYHYSTICYGSSLTSLSDLAEEKGYYFVGCNSAGNNAYFVRKDKIGNINIKSIEEGYSLSKFKEGRDKAGYLTYIRGEERIKQMAGVKVFNTRTNEIEEIN